MPPSPWRRGLATPRGCRSAEVGPRRRWFARPDGRAWGGAASPAAARRPGGSPADSTLRGELAADEPCKIDRAGRDGEPSAAGAEGLRPAARGRDGAGRLVIGEQRAGRSLSEASAATVSLREPINRALARRSPAGIAALEPDGRDRRGAAAAGELGPDAAGAPRSRGAGEGADAGVRDALALALRARLDRPSKPDDRAERAAEAIALLAQPGVQGELDRCCARRRRQLVRATRAVRKAALSALRWREMERWRSWAPVHGLSLASVLLFAALGLAITFGLMGVINMAHGEMLTIGAYTTYVVQTLFRAVPGRARPATCSPRIPVAFLVARGRRAARARR